jgi:hypothetical protein
VGALDLRGDVALETRGCWVGVADLRFVRFEEEEEVYTVRWFVRLAGVSAAAFALVGMVFLVGMRTKSPAVVARVRRFNRSVTNPRVLRSAGGPGAPASKVRHAGRVSGRSYETPVSPFPVGDDFVIALPYGPTADWVRNVLTTRSAVLVHEGLTVPVQRPEVIPVEEVITDLPPSQRRTLRLFGVKECLRVRPALDADRPST